VGVQFVTSHAGVDHLEALDKPNIEVIVLEGSGHALEAPEGKGTSIIRLEALNRISALVKSTQGFGVGSPGHPSLLLRTQRPIQLL
jgi:hypothetical protein